jgi:hypothetical protein
MMVISFIGSLSTIFRVQFFITYSNKTKHIQRFGIWYCKFTPSATYQKISNAISRTNHIAGVLKLFRQQRPRKIIFGSRPLVWEQLPYSAGFPSKFARLKLLINNFLTGSKKIRLELGLSPCCLAVSPVFWFVSSRSCQ